MAKVYNTTGFIKEDRIYCNLDTMKRDTKNYNTVEILLYFYNRFQEILSKKGSLTIEDLEQVYREKPYIVEKSYYIRHNLFDQSNNKYYYVTSKPFKTSNDHHSIRIELTCPFCDSKYTPYIRTLSYNQKCFCQYKKVISKDIEDLKQTDEVYLKYHLSSINDTTYFIDNISYTFDCGLQYTYIIKCQKCGATKEVNMSPFKNNLSNYGEHSLFKKNPPCNCNQHLGMKTQCLRQQELEEELQKSEYYIKGSLKYNKESYMYSIQYKCSICGDTQEIITGSITQMKDHSHICSSCSSSIVGKTSIYSMLPDNYIPWSDKTYFETYIKNNPDFFKIDKFMAIDFLENQYNESYNKIYKFRHIQNGCEFNYPAYNMYRGLKFCPICEQDVLDSYGVLNTKTYLNQNNILYNTEVIQDNLFNPKTLRDLKFDFQIITNNNLKVFIEFDGVQHITGWSRNEESLKEIQYRDYIKNNYCYERNYILLRIPHYYDSIQDVTKILDEFFRLLNNNSNTSYIPQPIFNNTYIYDFIIYKGLENFQATREYLQKHNQYTNPNLSAIDF